MSCHRLLNFLTPVLILALSGCATYYEPRYGYDGVYYDQPGSHYRPAGSIRAGYVNPVIYPYWSLDYFYFSRYYHPYSVVVHSYDPWFYPYPGWYYGYHPGPRSRVAFTHGAYYYPWFSFGLAYHHYRPWRPAYVTYPRQVHHHHHYSEKPPGYQRVRQIDERIREQDRRDRIAAASGSRLPVGQRAPAVESLATSRQRPTTRRSAISAPDIRSRSTTTAPPVRRQASPPTRTEASPTPRRQSSSPPARSRSAPPQRQSSRPTRQRDNESERRPPD